VTDIEDLNSSIWREGVGFIEHGIDPGEPLDSNTCELSDTDQATLNIVHGSLEEALAALEEDHGFLPKGGVFTRDVLDV